MTCPITLDEMDNRVNLNQFSTSIGKKRKANNSNSDTQKLKDKPISRNNIKILTDYSKEIHDGIVTEFGPIPEKKTSSVFATTFSFLYSKLPGAEWMGSQIGGIIGSTYSADWSNALVKVAVSKIFPNQKTSWAEWISGRSATAGLQLIVTPYLAPLLHTLSVGTGAIAVPTMVIFAQAVYARYTDDAGKLNDLQNKKIEDLFKYDAANDQWTDAFGEPITSDVIKEVHDIVEQLEIIRQLKELKKWEVQRFFENQLVETVMEIDGKQKNIFAFQDGLILDEKMMKNFDAAVERLTSDNFLRKDVEIIKDFIHQLAIHTKTPTDESDWKSQVVECYIRTKGSYSGREKDNGEYTIVGYCRRDTGEPLSEEEVQDIQAECDRISLARIEREYNLYKKEDANTLKRAQAAA